MALVTSQRWRQAMMLGSSAMSPASSSIGRASATTPSADRGPAGFSRSRSIADVRREHSMSAGLAPSLARVHRSAPPAPGRERAREHR